MKSRAGRKSVVEFDPAAMVVNNLGDDCQAKPHAVLFRRVERVEYLLAHFGRHARAGVFHRDAGARSAVGSLWRDGEA